MRTLFHSGFVANDNADFDDDDDEHDDDIVVVNIGIGIGGDASLSYWEQWRLIDIFYQWKLILLFQKFQIALKPFTHCEAHLILKALLLYQVTVTQRTRIYATSIESKNGLNVVKNAKQWENRKGKEHWVKVQGKFYH